MEDVQDPDMRVLLQSFEAARWDVLPAHTMTSAFGSSAMYVGHASSESLHQNAHLCQLVQPPWQRMGGASGRTQGCTSSPTEIL